MLKKLLILLILTTISGAVLAESLYVKYRGNLDLAPFQCEWVTSGDSVYM